MSHFVALFVSFSSSLALSQWAYFQDCVSITVFCSSQHSSAGDKQHNIKPSASRYFPSHLIPFFLSSWHFVISCSQNQILRLPHLHQKGGQKIICVTVPFRRQQVTSSHADIFLCPLLDVKMFTIQKSLETKLGFYYKTHQADGGVL